MYGAMYDIPGELKKETLKRIPDDMQEVLKQFEKIRSRRISIET